MSRRLADHQLTFWIVLAIVWILVVVGSFILDI